RGHHGESPLVEQLVLLPKCCIYFDLCNAEQLKQSATLLKIRSYQCCLIHLRTQCCLPVIAFNEGPSTSQIVRAVLSGALDYIEWPCDTAKIMTAIELAEAAAASIGSLRLREARARSRVQRLTRREREVLEGVADGLSNRLIGERLHISPRTVEIHRANMLNKMGASHTSEAIRIAIEASLVGRPRSFADWSGGGTLT
ncbi:MAG: hypothetical protein J0M19_02975, partial [Sphingomonadales bacterium]|nr:hypothetical protein [Sphingomonadales bacterium]